MGAGRVTIPIIHSFKSLSSCNGCHHNTQLKCPQHKLASWGNILHFPRAWKEYCWVIMSLIKLDKIVWSHNLLISLWRLVSAVTFLTCFVRITRLHLLHSPLAPNGDLMWWLSASVQILWRFYGTKYSQYLANHYTAFSGSLSTFSLILLRVARWLLSDQNLENIWCSSAFLDK